jgi:NAD(P)-dependent dehydrogenase (short-subunit alcohol dehydrogenase family)
MAQPLEGRVAIVTGGGHGIGKAYCQALAENGAAIVVAEIDGDAAERTASDLRSAGARAIEVQTDVADEASTRAMAQRSLSAFGRIDVLVNNAAVFATIPISRVPLEEISVEEWDRVMAVNLRGVFLACKAVLPAMREQGYGKIINISSGTALNGSPTRIHYVTSKGGVLSFTRTLAREVGRGGIRVNAIAPGSTLSEENPTEEVIRLRQQRLDDRALPRVQIPADLVGSVVFFASAASDFITGQTLVVDGGNFMH